MRYLSRLMLSVVAMMFIVGSVFAQMPQDAHEGSEKWRARMESQMQEMFKDLNLSEEQKKLLEENRTKHREQMGELRHQMRELRQQIHQELQQTDLNMGKINELQGRIKETQGKILDYRLEGILAVHKILTPDQFKKFAEEMQKRKENFRGKMWKRFNKDGESSQEPSEEM